ncbi:MAG: hypothetical protein WDN30_02145 [Pararobbsia sp.]
MRFAETQFADWRIFVILIVALVAVLLWRRAPRLPACVAIVLLLAGFFECRLATDVDEHVVRVRFGFLPVYSCSIPLADIAVVSAQPASGSPMPAGAGAWGWGPHWDRDGTFAMTIRGSQGVLLTLRDGSRIRIGSQEPGALEQALRS